MTDSLFQLTLRAATEADLDAIMALEVQGFDPAFHESREVYRQRILTFPQGALMALHQGVSVGCFFSEIWSEDAAFQPDSFSIGHDIRQRHDPVNGRALYVASITLAPALRGGGLGLRFFQACLDRVVAEHPTLASVVLLVNEHWSAARRIYANAGFVEDGRLAGFFQTAGDVVGDGIIMSRPIPAPRP